LDTFDSIAAKMSSALITGDARTHARARARTHTHTHTHTQEE